MSSLSNRQMVTAINGMAGRCGIPAVEFADENGKRVFGWKVPKPRSVRARVHKIGGGFVFVKAGDKVRCVCQYEDGSRWDEGVGVLRQVTKDQEAVHLVYEDGSFPLAHCKGRTWRREFERVGDEVPCTDFSKVPRQVLVGKGKR